MDNASFHYTPWIEQMCRDAGVKLVYLLLYVENEAFSLHSS